MEGISSLDKVRKVPEETELTGNVQYHDISCQCFQSCYTYTKHVLVIAQVSMPLTR